MPEQVIELRLAVVPCFILETAADLVNGVVEAFDHMEQVNADDSVGKAGFGNGGIAVMHVTAEIFHALPLMEGILKTVYLEYLNGECTENQFHEAAVLLERFASYDEDQPKGFYRAYLQSHSNEQNKAIVINTKNMHCDRLVALGLLWTQYHPVSGGMHLSYGITEIGLVIGKAMGVVTIGNEK